MTRYQTRLIPEYLILRLHAAVPGSGSVDCSEGCISRDPLSTGSPILLNRLNFVELSRLANYLHFDGREQVAWETVSFWLKGFGEESARKLENYGFIQSRPGGE